MVKIILGPNEITTVLPTVVPPDIETGNVYTVPLDTSAAVITALASKVERVNV